MKRLPIIGVMGSGTELLEELGVPLGQELGKLPVHLLTGGGWGVMKTVSQSFCSVAERQGKCIGIIPTDPETGLPQSKTYPNIYVEIPIMTPLGVYKPENPDAVTRNHINILTSDVVVILPGGKGTKNEADLSVKFGKSAIFFGPKERAEYMPASIAKTEQIGDVIQYVRNSLGLKAALQM